MCTFHTHTQTHIRERERKTETLSSMNFMITTNEKPTTDTHTQEEAIPTQHWDSHPTTRGKEQEKNYKNNQKTINNMANKYIPMNNYCSKKPQSKDTEARYIYVYVYICCFTWKRAWQPTPVFLSGESPWTEEPGGLQSMRSQRVGHSWVTNTHTCCFIYYSTLLFVCSKCVPRTLTDGVLIVILKAGCAHTNWEMLDSPGESSCCMIKDFPLLCWTWAGLSKGHKIHISQHLLLMDHLQGLELYATQWEMLR